MASGLGPIQYLKRSPKSTLALASIALHSLDSDEDFDKCGAFDLLVIALIPSCFSYMIVTIIQQSQVQSS